MTHTAQVYQMHGRQYTKKSINNPFFSNYTEN